MINVWGDLEPGDLVIEHDGFQAVFVIVKDGSIMSQPHWDVVILSSNLPNNTEFTAFRSNWIRKREPIHDGHEVIRRGKTVLFAKKQG